MTGKHIIFNPPKEHCHPGTSEERSIIRAMTEQYRVEGGKFTIAQIYAATDDEAPLPIRMMTRKLLLAPPHLTYAPEVIGLLAGISDRPGMVTLYAYALAHYTFHRGPYSLPDSFAETFPHGLPTERYAYSVWRGQKIRDFSGEHNYLDSPEAWNFS